MPIKIPSDLPAASTLREENIFVMDLERAESQNIRPLRILVLNLMPTKIATETQLARLLGNTPLQIEMDLLAVSRIPKNTAQEHMISFYKTFREVKEEFYDGMIITGAPVEHLDFESVDYWPELCRIMEWTKRNVYCTLHICWGAQAGLYHHYGIPKHRLEKKLFGIYPHRALKPNSPIFRGLDDVFYVPPSRFTSVLPEDIAKVPELELISDSPVAGVFAVKSEDSRRFFIMGHPEYDADTLAREYRRDIDRGMDIAVPEHYFPDDDPTRPPVVNWRSAAQLFYTNWLNYYVYQTTPYDLSELE